ncbi:MAG: hypothetical protein KDB07_06235 [Planctomycetes bacterium]|nr:hypothetical protein [Planctomycetota bacterium]
MGAETRDYSIFHPSSLELGSDKAQVCLRKLVYARQQNRSPVKRDFDQQTRNKFEVGHDAHGKYQGWLKWDDPDRVHVEVTAEISELRMRGSCDVVIDWELSSGRMIKVGAEIKTSAEKTWMSMKNLPIIKHRDQAAAYAASLGLDAVVFFYECKNDQRLKEFVQPWSQLEPRWDRIQARLREMNQCIDTDTLPERRLVKYECDACPFAEQCKPFRIDGRRTERLTKILSTRVNDGDRY